MVRSVPRGPWFRRLTQGLALVLLLSPLVGTGTLLGSVAQAQLLPVDDRIDAFVVGPRFDRRSREHRAEVRLTNHSEYPVFSPLRIVVDGAPGERLVNRDGLTSSGEPYVDIVLPDGQLAPGERSIGTRLVFAERGSFRVRVEGVRFKFDALVAKPFALTAAPALTATVTGTSVPGYEAVVFTIGTALNEMPANVNLELERVDALGVGPSGPVPMRDDGVAPDALAHDGRYSAGLSFPTGALRSGDQLRFRVRAAVGGFPMQSNELVIGVTGFPTRAADSEVEGNQVAGVLGGANAGLGFVANEVLVQFPEMTPDSVVLAAIESALHSTSLGLSGVQAEVVGSILPLNTYQVRTVRALSSAELAEFITALQAQTSVIDAFGNALLKPTALPDDPGLVAGDPLEQLAVKLVNVPQVWEHTRGLRSDGSAIRVRVLDTGFETTHTDLGRVLGDGEVAVSGAKAGHGTRMSGIIGATGNNTQGIAGVAHEAAVDVDQILAANGIVDTSATGETPAWTLGQILMDLAVEPSATRPEVANISYAGRWEPGFAGDAYKVGWLCRGVRQATSAGVMLVVSAGNNTDAGTTSFAYPGRCNVDTGLAAADQVIEKQRLITVANTTLADALNSTSLSGSYVDVAIPGTNVVSTTVGGTFNRASGTSESAAIGSGSVALLLAAGADKDQIEIALKSTGAFLAPLGYERIDVLAALALLNQPPSIASNTFSVPENQALVGTVSALDPEGFALSYQILPGGDGGDFTLDPTTGALAFVSPPDFEAPADANGDNTYQVTVEVADGPAVSSATQRASKMLTVSVTDVAENTAPSVPSGQSFSLLENSAVGTVVGTVLANDAESPSGALTYAITSGNTGNAFRFDPGGVLVVNSQAALDFETTPSFALGVEVSDPGAMAGTGTVSVNLDDVVEGGTLVLDQQNLVQAGTTFGCGAPTPALSLYQGFVPTGALLGAVEVRLRVGGAFPAGGSTFAARILDGSASGAILGSGNLSVPGPQPLGGSVFPRVEFTPAINVVPGQTYFIELALPGDPILTWFGFRQTPNGPYAAAPSVGCGPTNVVEDRDFVFRTFALVP